MLEYNTNAHTRDASKGAFAGLIPDCLVGTHVACGTELPLSVFDLWAKLLQQRFLHPPDGRRLPACLQGQL